MKLKGLLLGMAVAICIQIAPPSYAAPTGDWVDTSEMTPVYSVENKSLAANGNVTTDIELTDYIIDFEVTMSSAGRWFIKRIVDGTALNVVDIRQAWVGTNQEAGKHMQQLVNGNGWFTRDDVDADFPAYTAGKKIGFRLQAKGTTMSVWAADFDAEGEPVYKYAGYYTHANVQKTGAVQLYVFQAETVDMRVYSLEGNMKLDTQNVSAKKGSSFGVQFSLEPNKTLASADFVLKDSLGTTVEAIGNVTGSGCNYTVILDEWIEYGAEYTLSLADGVKTVQGFGIKPINFTTSELPEYKLEITDVNISDETVTVSFERNVNEVINAVAVVGVYDVIDGIEECAMLKAQSISDESRDSFSLDFVELASGSTVRAYVLTDLNTIKSVAIPQEN